MKMTTALISNWPFKLLFYSALGNLMRKALHKFYRTDTGTPITNSPLDFFSQYKFLDDSIFGQSFFQLSQLLRHHGKMHIELGDRY